MQERIKIGIHTSIAGHPVHAVEAAAQLGCDTFQIFSASPRLWHGKSIPEAEAALFRERRAQTGLAPLAIHDNYLINLASPSILLRSKSIQAFHGELKRALALGADYLIAHPGSAGGTTRAEAIRNFADAVRQSIRGLKLNGLMILLENTAGMGAALGSRFAELKNLVDAIAVLPVGICLDTAHAFEAGYDIRSEKGLEATLAEIDRTVGLKRVKIVHTNDSKTPLGSGIDRHQHIGKGKIGLKAFARILNHPALAGRSFILETPLEKRGDDRRNLQTVRRLARLGGLVRQGRRKRN